MGVGEFLILAFIILCVYAIINKCIKLFEQHMKFEQTLITTKEQIDEDFKDLKD